jgi:hypothetical protein
LAVSADFSGFLPLPRRRTPQTMTRTPAKPDYLKKS